MCHVTDGQLALLHTWLNKDCSLASKVVSATVKFGCTAPSRSREKLPTVRSQQVNVLSWILFFYVCNMPDWDYIVAPPQHKLATTPRAAPEPRPDSL